MWQFFMERGKKVIQLAHHEALRMGHPKAETEESTVKKVEEGRRAAEVFYDGKKGQVIPVSDWLVKEVMSAYGDN